MKALAAMGVLVAMLAAGCAATATPTVVYDGMSYGEATERLGLEGYACTLTGTAIQDNVATRRSFCLKALKREDSAKCVPFHTVVLELNAFTMVVQRASESTGKAKGCRA